MLKIKLFGFAQASFANQPLPGFPHQQAWLLLCFLLLNKNHPHNRERLAAVFWEDQPAHVARKNFRNTLWRLRQVLYTAGAQPDDYLQAGEETVAFNRYAPYQLDVDVFESAAFCLNIPDQSLEPDQVAQLETAVAQYDGDLLENVYEDWCLFDRERLRAVYLNMLNKLMIYYGAHGSYAQGLSCGLKILAYEPAREDIHRQMMWIDWQMGDRTAALMQYKTCIQVLKDELGVEPMETTLHLYQQILRAPQPESDSLALTPAQADLQPIAQAWLQQLHHLHQVLEQTNAELAQLERMIYQTLKNSPR